MVVLRGKPVTSRRPAVLSHRARPPGLSSNPTRCPSPPDSDLSGRGPGPIVELQRGWSTSSALRQLCSEEHPVLISNPFPFLFLFLLQSLLMESHGESHWKSNSAYPKSPASMKRTLRTRKQCMFDRDLQAQNGEKITLVWRFVSFYPCRSGNFRSRAHSSGFGDTPCVFSALKSAKQPQDF